MQERQVFEYAVIRVVPRVERGEFLNLGVILFAKSKGFLGFRYHIDTKKLLTLFPETDLDEVRCQLESYDKICKGNASGGAIASLDLPSRFRWLTAKGSTIIQSSAIHPGLSDDPASTLEKLFREMAG